MGARKICILILGMHRSGTSALTRVISLHGAALPKRPLGPSVGNETGHWEPERLNDLFEAMMVEAGTDHLDWSSFDPASLGSDRVSYYKAATVRILREEFGNAETIVLKEPRICRFVPFFTEILESLGYDIKIIHITRNPLEVAASLEARNSLAPAIGQLVWLRHVLEAEVATRGRSRVFTSYEALLADWKNAVTGISSGVGLTLVADAATALQIDAFLNVGQRHHAVSSLDLETSPVVSIWVKDAFFALTKLTDNSEDDAAKRTLDAVRSGFDLVEKNLVGIVAPNTAARSKSYGEESRELQDDCAMAVKEIQEIKQELANVRRNPMKIFKDLVYFRLLLFLSNQSPLFSARRVERFAVSANNKDPNRSIGGTAQRSNAEGKARISGKSGVPFDAGKKTIVIVTHECSRTGAPILTLNLIAHLSPKYNVVCLALDGGDIINQFAAASTAFYLVSRKGLTPRRMKQIVGLHGPLFAIVNSIQSRMALEPLHSSGIPVVSLIHEFASYIRPRSALPDALKHSDHMVFSAKMTLNNAVSESSIMAGPKISVLPQGRCAIPRRIGDAANSAAEKAWLAQKLRPPGETDRRFLVIGIGTVEYRKGVDLFIECINNIKNRADGDRFRFVWIGGGFDLERDTGYSVFLDDQMKRAGVERQMSFLRPTSEIEVAYEAADVLLLSSRLDPLPNVAIDALSHGLPVLCFAETTGIADTLIANGLGQDCVAAYLDTNDLAQKVIALADAPDLYARVSDRSRAIAADCFDMAAYVSKLEAIALNFPPRNVQAVPGVAEAKD